jgi:hypothetical protein
VCGSGDIDEEREHQHEREHVPSAGDEPGLQYRYRETVETHPPKFARMR